MLTSILNLGYNNIVVVDDASDDNTFDIANQFPTVKVIRHKINLGSGGATRTGIEYALRNNAKYIATIDADGQHYPKDLDKISRQIHVGDYDLIVGSRFIQKNEIPKSRVFFNKIANIVSLAFTGKYVTDSQSGLKVMTADLARKISIEYNGFEFCMEIIKNASVHKARILEMPIFVMYSQDTMEKGQSLSTGINMIKRLLSPF